MFLPMPRTTSDYFSLRLLLAVFIPVLSALDSGDQTFYECDKNAVRLATGICQCNSSRESGRELGWCEASPQPHLKPGTVCELCPDPMTSLIDDMGYWPICGIAKPLDALGVIFRKEKFVCLEGVTCPSESLQPAVVKNNSTECMKYCETKLGGHCNYFSWLPKSSNLSCESTGECRIALPDTTCNNPFERASSEQSSVLFIAEEEFDFPSFDQRWIVTCSPRSPISEDVGLDIVSVGSFRECAAECVSRGGSCKKIFWSSNTNIASKSGDGFSCILNSPPLNCSWEGKESFRGKIGREGSIAIAALANTISGYLAPQGMTCAGGNTLPGNEDEASVHVTLEVCAEICRKAGDYCKAFVFKSTLPLKSTVWYYPKTGRCVMKSSADCKEVPSPPPQAPNLASLYYVKE